MSTNQIDAIVAQLDLAVAAARLRRDRLGWFAAMYGQTTRALGHQVAAGAFEHGERMGRFVERFAGRYLGPLEAASSGQPMARCWQVAADVARSGDYMILQHLLLGINAHVNLDLAVVAADIAPGAEIHDLRGDFMLVNAVLIGVMPKVRACIGQFSPLLDVIDRVGGADDDEVLRFSIRVARDEAWNQAQVLAATDDAARRAELVDALDRRVAVLARVVAHPGGVLQRAVDVVAATESDDVVKIMDALGQVTLDSP